ncbi:MAG: hypothetical protein ABIH24_10155 [Verrucomicrobiota bacterium]
MKKDSLNRKLRDYIRDNVSLREGDRNFVNAVYDAFKRVLDNNCIQIGSYPRFTAVRPLHDLDILYLIGSWDEAMHDPADMLKALHRRIKAEYENPNKYDLEVSVQTHSVSVSFKRDGEEVFAVDIVPAYSRGTNEFGQDMYMVPELVRRRHRESRKALYETLAKEHREMQWIASDPRGYIEVATRVNKTNSDFRRTVKFAKAWKNACKELSDDFPLKSFHIEQLITIFFRDHRDADMFDGIFDFFVTLPDNILVPQIIDRADSSKYIDSYLIDLTKKQRDMIRQARDHLLKTLEELADTDPIDGLFNVQFYQRSCANEQYLFDQNIPTLTDSDFAFRIRGDVQERQGGFRKFILDAIGFIPVDRKISFRIKGDPPPVDMFKWKVKNGDCSPQPRGEITDRQTMNDPEHTKYIGSHYVECYAILGHVCVAKAKQNVKLGN